MSDEAQELTVSDRTKDTLICVFCAGIHDMVPELGLWLQPCPRIKKIERSPGGEAISVEFWPFNGLWESRVAFLSDMHDEEELSGSTT